MSTSYDDCQDVLKERERFEKEDPIRQRLLGPIGQRLNDQPYTPTRTLALNCIAAKMRELLDNVELVEGYSEDTDTGQVYHDECGWFIDREFMGELEELLDDLNTIEKEGW